MSGSLCPDGFGSRSVVSYAIPDCPPQHAHRFSDVRENPHTPSNKPPRDCMSQLVGGISLIEVISPHQGRQLGSLLLAVLSRLALQRFFARTDFPTSKMSISRRSCSGSAVPFKGSRQGRLVFMSSTLSTSQATKRHSRS